MSHVVEVYGSRNLQDMHWDEKYRLNTQILDDCVANLKFNFLKLGYLAGMFTGDVPSVPFFCGRVLPPHSNISCSIVDYLCNFHSLSKSTVYSAIACYKQFCQNEGTSGFSVRPEFEPYSQSQLIELLPLSPSDRQKVTPDMTVKAIRALKKAVRSAKTAVDDLDQLLLDPDSGRPENGTSEVPEPPKCVTVTVPLPDSSCFFIKKTAKLLTNDKMRAEFIRNYEKWGVWLDVPALRCKHYRYDIGDADKHFFVVSVYENDENAKFNLGPDVIWHLCRENKQGLPTLFSPGGCALSVLVDFLRKLGRLFYVYI